MAARKHLIHTVSTSPPISASLGDEWYDPLTNTLYKCVAVNGTQVEFKPVSTVSSSSTSTSVTGGYTVQTVSGAGTTQGTATPVSGDLILVSTVASGTGIVLPTDSTAKRIVIRNSGLNDLKVYPATGAQINSLGTNVAYLLGTATTLEFIGYTSTQWYTINATFA